MDNQEDPELALALRLSMENQSQNEDPDLALALRLSMEEIKGSKISLVTKKSDDKTKSIFRKGVHQCPICTKSLKTEDSKIKHVKQIHNMSPQELNYLNMAISSQSEPFQEGLKANILNSFDSKSEFQIAPRCAESVVRISNQTNVTKLKKKYFKKQYNIFLFLAHYA